MPSILITPRGFAKYGKDYRKKLEEAGYIVDWNDTGKQVPRDVFVRKARQAEGIIVGLDECDRDLLVQCRSLKAIVKYGVGTDNIDINTCTELGIKVGRCVGTNSNAVAELTIGLMFACARSIVSDAIIVKEGGWEKPTGIELTGKMIGILGFGNVGRNVARMAHGIGMKVRVYDIFPISKETLKEYNAVQQTLQEILQTCDVVTIHVPLTKETFHLIGKDEFAMMKKTAVLINAARGGIVDEIAMLDALKSHQIMAAAADVFTEEPPKKEPWIMELLSLDNYIQTSHIGSRSREAEIDTVQRATEVLLNLLKEKIEK